MHPKFRSLLTCMTCRQKRPRAEFGIAPSGNRSRYCSACRKRPSPVPAPNPNPAGLCLCGCGQPTKIAKRTRVSIGDVQGCPKPYLPHHGNNAKGTGTRVAPQDRYVVDPATGCHNWLGPFTRQYPEFTLNGERVRAHVWHYERKHGPMPEGFDAHHKCRNTRCVNPDHIEPLEPGEHSKLHNQERRERKRAA